MFKTKKAFIPQILVFTLIFISAYGYAQDNNNETPGFNYANELNKMVSVPNSPEAQAFTKYGDVPVNLHQGSTNVSIPIYTIKGLEMDLPISLTYDMNARKVEDVASNVGLGWNLNVGGRISRIANGSPDDYILIGGPYTTLQNVNLRNKITTYRDRINNGFEFNSVAELDDYFLFLEDVQKGIYDTQVDYFSLNVMGISDYITMDMEHFNPHAIDNPKLKVSLTRDLNSDGDSISTWHVVDGQGNEYFFEQSEITNSRHENDISQYPIAYNHHYNSSWVLTKIVSKNKKDTYLFEYTDFGYWPQYNNFPVSKVINTIHYNTTITDYPIGSGQQIAPGISYKIKQRHLTSIKHNNKTIVDINLKNRFDLGNGQNSAIDHIEIFNPLDYNQVIYHYKFNHSYFGIEDHEDPELVDSKSIRLKFDSLQIAGSDYNFEKQYAFSYKDPEDMPARNVRGQDVLGFFNGSNSTGSVLYPQLNIDGFSFAGANRDFSEEDAKIGILKTITYPTGGRSEFEYEQHQESFYELTTSYTPITSVFAYSDQESPDLCGNCCIDASQAEVSDGESSAFYVPSENEYDFLFSNNSGGLNTSAARKAFVIGPYPTAASVPDVTIDDFLCYSNSLTLLRTFEGNHNHGLRETHTLSPGHYKIFAYNLDLAEPNTVVGDSPTTTTSVGLTVYKLNQSTNVVVKKYPGLRIKNITNKADDSPNGLVSKKSYLYKKTRSTPVSGHSLVVKYTPALYYFLPIQELVSNPGNEGASTVQTVQTLHRLAKPITHSGPNVVYKYVIEETHEIDENNAEAPGFYTHHEFIQNGSKGILPASLSGASSYHGNYKSGLLKKKSDYTASGHKKNVVENSYVSTTNFTGHSFGVRSQSDRNLKFITYYQKQNNKISFKYQDGVMAGFNGENVAGMLYQAPNNCSTPPNIKCEPSTQRSTIEPLFLGASGSVGGLSQSTNTSYLSGENMVQSTNTSYLPGENMVQTTNNTYNEVEKGFLLKQSITTDSRNLTTITNYDYPIDFEEETGGIYTNMLADNQLEIPIQSTSIYNNKSQVVKNNYIEHGFGFYVASIQTSKTASNDVPESTTPLEDRIHYNYYPNGNIKSSYQSVETDDFGNTNYSNLSTYIWGYNNSQLIAKIDNATYSDISSYVSNLQSLSNADNDNCREANCNEQQLRDALDALRTALPNAIVTTYTYDPLVGVTSITDPRGQTQYFEYDALHRLKQVRDAEDHILSTNTYNYRTQN